MASESNNDLAPPPLPGLDINIPGKATKSRSQMLVVGARLYGVASTPTKCHKASGVQFPLPAAATPYHARITGVPTSAQTAQNCQQVITRKLLTSTMPDEPHRGSPAADPLCKTVQAESGFKNGAGRDQEEIPILRFCLIPWHMEGGPRQTAAASERAPSSVLYPSARSSQLQSNQDLQNLHQIKPKMGA